MKFRFLSLYLIIIIILGTFLPLKTLKASSSSILVNIAPENPAPGENTNITLNSYAYNLDSVLIVWSVNGANASSGIGKKSFSLSAPSAGSETDVTATISLPDGTQDTKIIIRPTVMTLLWQANDSYVPPFYKGKALPSAGSSVKVVAMPEVKSGGGSINPKNMTYSWKKDYTNNVDGSGYGKNSFTFLNDYLENSNNIDVIASTTDQKYSSEKSIDIGITKPKITFYKHDISMGTLWEQALSDGYKIIGDEIIEATPYFISPNDLRIPILTWNWTVNDNTANIVGYNKNRIPLKVQAGVTGTAKINLNIENTEKIFETVNNEINVNF